MFSKISRLIFFKEKLTTSSLMNAHLKRLLLKKLQKVIAMERHSTISRYPRMTRTKTVHGKTLKRMVLGTTWTKTNHGATIPNGVTTKIGTKLTGSATLLTQFANLNALLQTAPPVKSALSLTVSTPAPKKKPACKTTFSHGKANGKNSIAATVLLKFCPTALRFAITLTALKIMRARFAGSKNARMAVSCITVPFGSRLTESGTAKFVKMTRSCPMSASKTFTVVLKISAKYTKTLSLT